MVLKKIGGICLLSMEASLSVPMLWFLELIPWYVNEETRLVCTLDYEREKKDGSLHRRDLQRHCDWVKLRQINYRIYYSCICFLLILIESLIFPWTKRHLFNRIVVFKGSFLWINLFSNKIHMNCVIQPVCFFLIENFRKFGTIFVKEHSHYNLSTTLVLSTTHAMLHGKSTRMH
jgi:hypothetical protein